MSARKRSSVWKLFSKLSTEKSICNMCGHTQSIKSGSTGNLRRHLRNKHKDITFNPDGSINGEVILGDYQIRPDHGILKKEKNRVIETRSTTVKPFARIDFHEPDYANDDIQADVQDDAMDTGGLDAASTTSAAATNNNNTTQQLKIDYTDFENQIDHTEIVQFEHITESVNQEQFENALLGFVVKCLQPFSNVDSPTFRKLTSLLNPTVVLPTRETFYSRLLTGKYDEVRAEVLATLEQTIGVCITMNTWRSCNDEDYIAVSCQFIDVDSDALKSVLLSCFFTDDENTAEIIKENLEYILNEWQILAKVVAIVTGNTPVLIGAAELLHIPHVVCFADAQKMTVQNGLCTVEELQKKAKTILAHFKRNTVEVLETTNHNLKTVTIKATPTHWNSALVMFQQILQMEDSLKSFLELFKLKLPVLTQNDWKVIYKLCEVLEVFNDVTKELSAEQEVTISKTLLLIAEIKDRLQVFASDPDVLLCQDLSAMIGVLTSEFASQTHLHETNAIIAEATFLDPRFKKYGLPNPEDFEKTVTSITNIAVSAGNHSNSSSTPGTSKHLKKSIWHKFDQKISTTTPNISEGRSRSSCTARKSLWDKFDQQTVALVQTTSVQCPRMAVVNEIKMFIQEPLLERSLNPIRWWRERKTYYPMLFDIAMARLCVMATSALSETIFAHVSELISYNHRSISAEELNKLLFLHCNM